MRILLAAACAVWLCSCGGPPADMDSIAIVGAVLVNGPEAIEHSIVIVREGRIAAAGAQALTPIPKTALIVNATGKFLVYGKAPARVAELERFEAGKSADFLLLAADPRADERNFARVERRMSGGQWNP